MLSLMAQKVPSPPPGDRAHLEESALPPPLTHTHTHTHTHTQTHTHTHVNTWFFLGFFILKLKQ